LHATLPGAIRGSPPGSSAVPLCPEIELSLTDDLEALWGELQARGEASAVPPPYWSIAWVGGQALARYVLDHPALVRGRTVLDFGAGTGLATIELIKGLDEKGLLKKMEREGIDFKLLLFDLPSNWFARAYELLARLPFVEFHSLRDPATGEIRQVTEQLDGESVDVILASMVLHLIPPKVMPAVFASLAGVLKAGGAFIWNTPDTTPTLPETTVIHTANRALRAAISAVLDGDLRLDALLASLRAMERARYADLPAALEHIQHDLTPARRAKAKAAVAASGSARSISTASESHSGSPKATSPCSPRVRPVPTISAMTSARPSCTEISTAPSSRMLTLVPPLLPSGPRLPLKLRPPEPVPGTSFARS
jgi:SAM-dependent methyltransferase